MAVKPRKLKYNGPADHFIVALQRMVQPGDEVEVEAEDAETRDRLADGLLSAYGFSEAKAKKDED